jgi:hypothetical protein
MNQTNKEIRNKKKEYNGAIKETLNPPIIIEGEMSGALSIAANAP